MNEIVLMGDARVAAIGVEEVGEPLVAVSQLPLSPLKDGLGADRSLLRASVAERLVEADRQLPDGLRLLYAEGRANRAILSAAMEQAGFVNYPTEWWHWSYGDRYWALTTGAPTAHYGMKS